MRVLVSTCLILSCALLHGQSVARLTLLSEHLAPAKEQTGSKGIQIHQFLDTCIYDHVCGEFTGGSFREFGLVKGFALSIDRRLRCNQLAKSQLLPIRFTPLGKVTDHWKDYRFETE